MAANTKETRVCKPDRDFLLFQEADQVATPFFQFAFILQGLEVLHD